MIAAQRGKDRNNHYLIFSTRKRGNAMLTLKQKRQISKYLRANYSICNIRFGFDGAVTANRDGKCGRFFMGWDNRLLSESAERKGAY